MKAVFAKFRNGYVRFIEKQGFPIVVTLCVAVITATALWKVKAEAPYISPTPPVMENVSAAQLMQQSLRNTAAHTPAPTAAPQLWTPPLTRVEVLTSFHRERMIQSASGVWSVHDAVDLKTSPGESVHAIADGIITATGKDQLKGAWIEIDHGAGILCHYAGMAATGSYLPDDDVYMGDVIGYAGNGLAEEVNLGSHLHLRVIKDGSAVNPLTLWNDSY